MPISLDMIRRTKDGVLLSAPEGEVLLKRTEAGITAEYAAGPLLNGSARQYAEQAKRSALRHARKIDLPWTSDPRGGTTITNHEQFYAQTFSTTTHALETLRRWSVIGSFK